MMKNHTKKSGSWTPQIQKKIPSLAPPPIVVQPKPTSDEKIPMPEYKPMPVDWKHPLMTNISDLPPIQTKLIIGEPRDKYEQEADTVARKVVNEINSPTIVQRDRAQVPESVANPPSKTLSVKSESQNITVSPLAGMMQRQGERSLPKSIPNISAKKLQRSLENQQKQQWNIGKNVVTHKELMTLLDFAKKLVIDYPSNQYAYIGMGGSPAPIIAMLKHMGCETYEIPLSFDKTDWNFYGSKKDGDRRVEALENIQLMLEETGIIKSNKSKKLVIDWGTSGLSITLGRRILSYFLPGEVDGLELTTVNREKRNSWTKGQGDEGSKKIRNDMNLGVLKSQKFSTKDIFWNNMSFGRYKKKGWRTVGSWEPGKKSYSDYKKEEKNKQSTYTKLSKQVKEVMEAILNEAKKVKPQKNEILI